MARKGKKARTTLTIEEGQRLVNVILAITAAAPGRLPEPAIGINHESDPVVSWSSISKASDFLVAILCDGSAPYGPREPYIAYVHYDTTRITNGGWTTTHYRQKEGEPIPAPIIEILGRMASDLAVAGC